MCVPWGQVIVLHGVFFLCIWLLPGRSEIALVILWTFGMELFCSSLEVMSWCPHTGRIPRLSIKGKNYIIHRFGCWCFIFPLSPQYVVEIANRNFYFKNYWFPLYISHSTCIQLYNSGPFLCQSWCGFNKENIWVVLIFVQEGILFTFGRHVNY